MANKDLKMRGLFQIAILASLLLLASGCGSSDVPSAAAVEADTRLEVEVALVYRAPIVGELELFGSLIPARLTKIVSEVDGVIREISNAANKLEFELGGQHYSVPVALNIGHRINQGDVLVQIEPKDFELALQVTQADLVHAKSELEQLQAWKRPEEIARIEAQRDETLAHFQQAHAELERAQKLFDKNVLTASEYDLKLMQDHAAAAQLAAAEADLEIARTGPTPEEIAVAKAEVAAAEADVRVRARQLEQTVIRAPYDAVVTERYLDVGDRVTVLPRMEILEIMDNSIITAQVGVPEKYLGQIHVGDNAEIRAEGVDGPVDGVVSLINAKVDYETRTFRVRVSAYNQDRRLKPGAFARVTTRISSGENHVAIPTNSVAHADGRPIVYVFENGRVQQRPIEMGMVSQDLIEVRAGLKEGEQIVVSDTALLSDGMPVRLKNGTALAQRPGS